MLDTYILYHLINEKLLRVKIITKLQNNQTWLWIIYIFFWSDSSVTVLKFCDDFHHPPFSGFWWRRWSIKYPHPGLWLFWSSVMIFTIHALVYALSLSLSLSLSLYIYIISFMRNHRWWKLSQNFKTITDLAVDAITSISVLILFA